MLDIAKINPEEEGKTHINMYSKSRTEVGKMLSNFYEFPAETEVGEFNCIEGYWYYLSFPDDFEEKEELKTLCGSAAKKKGLALRKKIGKENIVKDPDFQEKILKQVRKKIEANKEMFTEDLIGLPIVHYYNSRGRIVNAAKSMPWLLDGINEIVEQVTK